MSNSLRTALAVIVGLLLGALLTYLFVTPESQHSSSESSAEKKPLYWVAPMDANYRRDKPGKSPMGMDLVPVYEESDSSGEHGPGAVKISPAVINNLGVRTQPVTMGSLNNAIHTVGYVQYDQDSLLHIHPRVEGWVETLFVKAAGNPVEKDQPLYTLYSPQLVNAQEEFIIALKRGDARLISAASERLRALQLPNSVISELRRTREVKHTITFTAPQSGVVDDLRIAEGFFIQPGTTLMSIGQLEQVWVEAEIFERDAQLVEVGLPVTMTLDFIPGRAWQGEVDYIYPSLNVKNRTLRVRLKFDNPDRTLQPNMFAQVTIHAETDEQTMLVPKSSVIRTGKQSRVVVALGEGMFKSVAVETGRVDSSHVEILSGLMQDDEVVTSAQFLIDSESSISSDFARMSPDDKPSSVWAEGKVNRVMKGHRMANITHKPVKEWDWPEMTMDFTVAESVDMNKLANADSLHFEMTKTAQGDYLITDIHVMTQKDSSANQATVTGKINSIDRDSRVLNISRGPIEKWNRGPATMDFVAAEDLDLTGLQEGQEIEFTFEVGDEFIIIDIKSLPQIQMEHSQHNMQQSNEDIL
ncbi:efflux RND transporter periplasmic adaptor subunit [Alteromonas sp. ASW11-130]|uniref:efflux RND transporter periplasmic adaptor subunit n=1 Tax=Alteromonas sp. ASW11-130 TaxID=3015775 RepID=UPI0022429740|nr:efflux RND transporter periplasmic adaptor subunit [Alteromonas sp. ASW11-130]MCW8091139.1 efflux RND transporter periplasmic adaptor subunit [Alteromonas sp. ASW11-130]